MLNQTAYSMGANRSCIRDLFEYGRARAAVVGEENVFDYSLGNPSIPSPAAVDEAVLQILLDTPTLQVHGYTSAVGDAATRQAIADDLNRRYDAGCRGRISSWAAVPRRNWWRYSRRWLCQRENYWPLPPISRSTSHLPRRRA